MRDITSRWQRKEVSNFEYLSFLNSLADRSKNDLTQFCVVSLSLYIYISVYLSFFVCVYLSVCRLVGQSTFPSVFLYLYVRIFLRIKPSVYHKVLSNSHFWDCGIVWDC